MTSFFAVTDNDDILALQPRLTADDAGVRRIALIDLADLEEPDGLLWLVDRLGQDPAKKSAPKRRGCWKRGKTNRWWLRCARR